MTVKNPEGDKDQDLIFGIEGDICRRSRDRMRPSKSSILESERFWRKLKFQENGRVDPRIEEIGVFLFVTILSSLGYWTPKLGPPTTSLPRTEFYPRLLPQTE